MIKINNFIKGFFLFLIGFLILAGSGFLINHKIFFAIIKLICMGFFTASLVFFILSLVKEKLIFKILSAIFIIWTITLLLVQIIIEIKYTLEKVDFLKQSQLPEITEVTQKYSNCVNEVVKKFYELNEKSLTLTSDPKDYEKWIQLQKEFIQADINLKKCLDEIFTGKRIFVK